MVSATFVFTFDDFLAVLVTEWNQLCQVVVVSCCSVPQLNTLRVTPVCTPTPVHVQVLVAYSP